MIRKSIMSFVLGLGIIFSSPILFSEYNQAYSQKKGGYQRPSYTKPSTSSKSSSENRPSYTKPSTSPKSSFSNNSGNKKISSYGLNLADAQKKVESREKMLASPKLEFIAPGGKSIKIDRSSKPVEKLRNDITKEKIENRSVRQSNFYNSYSHLPSLPYNDPYGSFFHYWILSQSVNNIALWLYHHDSIISNERRIAMMSSYSDLEKAKLESEIEKLKSSGLTRDPSYVPSGIPDCDLMYNDQYVNAVCNRSYVNNPFKNSAIDYSGVGKFFTVLGTIILSLLFLAFLIWFIFYKNW